MVVVNGTNAGFVTVAPTSDPDGTYGTTIDSAVCVTKDTSPAGATKITEIGWYTPIATQESNFEVGLYSMGGSGEAGDLIQVERTNAKGTSAGWIVVTVDWNISGSTDYWLGVQLDNTSTTTTIDREISGGDRHFKSAFTLPDPYGTPGFYDGVFAIYALVEVSIGVTRKIKISGTFQDKPIKTKVAGTFEDKPIKIKVGGTFQDA